VTYVRISFLSGQAFWLTAYNSNTWGAEVGGAWVWGQLGLHSRTLTKKKKKKNPSFKVEYSIVWIYHTLLSIHPSSNCWVPSTFWLLLIMLLWICVSTYLFWVFIFTFFECILRSRIAGSDDNSFFFFDSLKDFQFFIYCAMNHREWFQQLGLFSADFLQSVLLWVEQASASGEPRNLSFCFLPSLIIFLHTCQEAYL
jgi:hypothetical protein